MKNIPNITRDFLVSRTLAYKGKTDELKIKETKKVEQGVGERKNIYLCRNLKPLKTKKINGRNSKIPYQQSRDNKKQTRTMKRVFLTVAVIATMGLVASCNSKKDCTCTAKGEHGVGGKTWEVKDYEGNCEDVKWANLPGITQEEINRYVEMQFTLDCVDKAK